jgi:hypothetical protein
MFKTMSEEQYLETVTFSKMIYRGEVIKNSDITAKSFTLAIKRGRADYAFKKHQSKLETDAEKMIFKLNLAINDNYLFSECFLNCCSRYLGTQNIKRLIVSFNLRKNYLVDEWNNIITEMSHSYYISPIIITQKIAEILTFHNIYYKDLEAENKEQTKSLSKR